MSAFRVYEPHELGRDGYPAEWHATVKHQVREDAGHRCVRCHHPYRRGEHGRGEWSPCDENCTHSAPVRASHDGGATWATFEVFGADFALAPDLIAKGLAVEARWRILTVHHLDGNKANCRWWNLVALCQRCHLQIQGKVQMARVWPWEHTEWFRPYVAGYYAHVYLGEDLSREQAEQRTDELLALERAA